MATAAAYSATSCSRFFSAPLACKACHERLPARPLITAQRIPVWNGSQLSGELARPTSEYPKNGDVEVETKTSHASWSLEYASSKCLTCPCVMEQCSLMLDCGLVADCSIDGSAGCEHKAGCAGLTYVSWKRNMHRPVIPYMSIQLRQVHRAFVHFDC
jgi:hypothetical protein